MLMTQADWAWPMALRDIFKPRGVNLLVADGVSEFVNVLRHRRIAATIVDTDSGPSGGLWTLRIIRLEFPRIPCIILTSDPTEGVLEEALELDAFSVIDKPVDLGILRDQLNRLFVRNYSSHIFSY
ncbi:MAG: response regulator [Sedimentisphaerales bacterium]|nr:response regulator [Sedimentisphaerales bacterium]